MNPLDYGLCNQTVTIYRKENGIVTRQVAENCYLATQNSSSTEIYGKSRLKQFLLIIPGDHPLQCGDRIFAGIGPKEVDWQHFLPVMVPQLYEVGYTKPFFWKNEVTHWEAGAERRIG